MDAGYVSALAALAGSAIGALASVATTWLTHHSQQRAQRSADSLVRREKLYEQFIDEASNLFADALTHSLENTTKLVLLYAITNKLRLFAPADVVAKAETVLETVVQTYYAPNLDIMRPEALHSAHMDALQAFSEACRRDLRG